MKKIGIFLILVAMVSVTRAAEWWNNDVYQRHDLVMLDPDWESVWGQYANNGNLMVQVYVGDQRLESYECAVYDKDGEQRECKSSMVDLGMGTGWCMLTIHGDNRENLSFRIAYENASGMTLIREADESYEYYVNCMDLIGGMGPDGQIDPNTVLTLHLADKPGWTAHRNDGSLLYRASGEIDKAGQQFLTSATTCYLYGKWAQEQLALLKTNITGANPNCLYYFEDDMTVPADWNNAIQKGAALSDIHLQDSVDGIACPFRCPESFSLGEHRATYTREWRFANGYSGWQTLSLPFRARVTATAKDDPEGELTEVLPLKDLKMRLSEWRRGTGYWLCSVTYADMATGIHGLTDCHDSYIEANSPYVISFPGSYFTAEYEGEALSLDMTGRKIVLECIDESIEPTTDQLIGSWQETSKDNFTFQGTMSGVENEDVWILVYATGETGRDRFEKTQQATVLPFHAYLKPLETDTRTFGSVLPFSGSQASVGTSFSLSVIDDTPLCISTTEVGAESAPGFSLTGIRVTNNYKGIVIRNNRKEIKK